MTHHPASPLPSHLRLVRIAGLGLAGAASFVAPVLGPNVYLEDLSLTPGLTHTLILALIGYQAFRWARPWHAGERRVVLHETSLVLEGAMISLGLLCVLGGGLLWQDADAFMLWEVYALGGVGAVVQVANDLPTSTLLTSLLLAALPLFGLAFIVGVRKLTVIDGAARRIVELGVIPRVSAFDAIDGLGIVEVRRVSRARQHMGSTFHVAVFAGGKPRRRYGCPTADEAESLLRRIHAATGAPLGRRAAGDGRPSPAPA